MIDFQFLKQHIDLLSLVREKVRLTHSGSYYRGLCPFHQEKTPSFYVYLQTQSYKCFGCGAHGDGIQWVCATMNLEVREAAEYLCKRYGIPIGERVHTPATHTFHDANFHVRCKDKGYACVFFDEEVTALLDSSEPVCVKNYSQYLEQKKDILQDMRADKIVLFIRNDLSVDGMLSILSCVLHHSNAVHKVKGVYLYEPSELSPMVCHDVMQEQSYASIAEFLVFVNKNQEEDISSVEERAVNFAMKINCEVHLWHVIHSIYRLVACERYHYSTID